MLQAPRSEGARKNVYGKTKVETMTFAKYLLTIVISWRPQPLQNNIQLRSNKHQTLYNGDSYVVALASNPDGTGIISSHVDGSIYRYNFPDSNQPGPAYSKICTHSSVAYALSWGRAICAAGNDQLVSFYGRDGSLERTFDYSGEPEKGMPQCKEFTCAAFNNTGDSVAVGNFDCFYTYSYNAKTEGWDENEVKVVENMYSVTSMSWKHNGSTLGVGTLCGLLDLYDACIRRYTYKKIFELTYVSPSQVLVRKKSEKHSNLLKSKFGNEILKISIHADSDTQGWCLAPVPHASLRCLGILHNHSHLVASFHSIAPPRIIVAL